MTDPASSLPDYDALALLLREAGADQSPAEAHGILTGLLCAPGEAEALWRGLLFGQGESPSTAALHDDSRDGGGRQRQEQAAETLAGLLGQTRAMLDDAEFGFEPLLPAGDDGLAAQLEGFTDWCRGFLLGLAGGGVQEHGLSPEAGEFLKDVVQMSGAEMEMEGMDPEGEAKALVELVEYLRAGVQLIYDEREPTRKLH